MVHVDERTLDELRSTLPPKTLITDPASMDAYRWDRANDPSAGVPLVVVRPTSMEQVQNVVRIAAAHKTPIVPRGAGSGLSGGSTAVHRGIVLSLDRMNSIEVDPVTRTLVAGPGALNADIKNAAAGMVCGIRRTRRHRTGGIPPGVYACRLVADSGFVTVTNQWVRYA